MCVCVCVVCVCCVCVLCVCVSVVCVCVCMRVCVCVLCVYVCVVCGVCVYASVCVVFVCVCSEQRQPPGELQPEGVARGGAGCRVHSETSAGLVSGAQVCVRVCDMSSVRDV